MTDGLCGNNLLHYDKPEIGAGTMTGRTMKRASIATSAIGALLSTIAAPAHAQQGKMLQFDLSGSLLYDSNVARGSDAAAASRGLEKEDIRLSPAVGVTLNKTLGVHQVALTGSAGYDFYTRNERLNRERVALDASATLRLPICTVDLRTNFSRRQSDLGDLSVIPGDPVSSSKNVQTAKGAGATASCGGAVGLRPTAMVDWSDAQNSAEVRKASDNRSFTYDGGVLYTHPSIGNITLYVGKREVDYPNRIPSPTGALDSFDANRYGLIYSRDIGAQLTVGGEIQYTDVKLGNGRDGFSGTNWRVNATLSLAQLQITGETRRAVEPSLGFDANFILQSNHSLTLRYALSQRLTTSLNGTLAVRDYDYGIGVVPGQIVHDNMKRASVGLSFLVSNRITLSTEGSYQKRNANGSLYDYDGYQVALRLSTSF